MTETIVAIILVVDDDSRLRRSLTAILDGAGHHISVACDGEEGWALLQTQAFDVVLTDVYMPEMDGIGFINQIRDSFPGQRVIAMSGGGLATPAFVLGDALELGAAVTLQKPFSRLEVLEAVRTLLEIDAGA